MKYERIIRYSLIAIGILLFLASAFVDFSWLKSIGDTYAADGDCNICDILDVSMAILCVFGLAMIIFGFRYLNSFLSGKVILDTYLEIIILMLLGLYLIFGQIRGFDNDEYEHLHNAWLMIEGTIPYFTIKSIHTPLLEWFIIFFMQITGENTTIIQVMRLFMIAISIGSLWLVYLITKLLFEIRTAGLVAVLLIITNLIWLRTSLEIRPDSIMLFFALASFWQLIRFYKTKNGKHLIICTIFACLSMLGKQNAAVFYFAVGIMFLYDIIFQKKFLGKKSLIILALIAISVFFIDDIFGLITVNVNRHLLPGDNKFWPSEKLLLALKLNPTVFVLFALQLFSPIMLKADHKALQKYLYCIPITCFVFLFLMNRPFLQEMVVMLVFMSMLVSNLLVEIMQKLRGRGAYALITLIALPGIFFISGKSATMMLTKDLETTKDIIELSDREDLVFDAYGKAIFRHHPLEPEYLIYSPEKFNRLEQLKESQVKYLIKDNNYYLRLPSETLEWFDENFVQTNKNPNIYVRNKKII